MMDRPATHKPRTILFINLYSEMGGGEHALYNLVKRLDRTQFRPLMMFNERGTFAAKVESLGIETVVLPYRAVMLRELVRPGRLFQMLKSSGQITRYLKQDRAEAIHCSDVLSLLLIAYPVVRFRIPVVYSVIFFYEWMRVLLFNLLAILLVDKIITNSSIVREYMRGRTFFLSRKIEVIHQGVDSSVFRPSRNGDTDILRAELGLDRATPLVGMVGRYDPQKGHKIFLEAASVVLRERPDVRFVVIGGVLFSDVFPFYKDYYKDVMKCHNRLGLEGRVYFISHREDMPEVMRSLDIFVLPSIQEGFGLVLLEALASGVPVVASESAGAVEVVRDLPAVYLAETGNPGSFADKIFRALEAIEHRKRMPSAQAPLNFATPLREKLDWGACVKKMEGLYATVSSGGHDEEE